MNEWDAVSSGDIVHIPNTEPFEVIETTAIVADAFAEATFASVTLPGDAVETDTAELDIVDFEGE